MGYQGGRRYGDSDRNWDRGWAGRNRDSDRYRYGTRGQFGGPGYRQPPEDYDPDERGFFDRAGDEVRSWFGDEEAERRREYDEYYNRPYGDPRDQSSRIGYASASNSSRYLPNRGYSPYSGERSGYGSEDHGYRVRAFGPDHDYGEHHDANYHAWRQQRINELDRDYAEYRNENRQRFNNEFGTWRSRRNEQRSAVQTVREHMEVVGSDGEHVGTVDKLRGDRIILTKGDQDAGGIHHSVPSSWIRSVDAQKVTLEKTAEETQAAWRTEHEQQALFGSRDEGDYADRYRSTASEKGRYR
ncbi:SWFGD domain-containing protein [Sphingobium sp. LB126]|uniref:DUF2171 domain-containing protein n=1 Tax=Sphingobium sp. LB126 TaxID=1983755 RepID=UPI000C2081AC|nr:DUF2171 domain-containing protein [Sphingobium sp. LB126]PJG47398.1 SWFGD domain-containing protein [Sphingobium sp. LB126]